MKTLLIILLLSCFSFGESKTNQNVFNEIKDAMVTVGSDRSMYGSGFVIEGGYIMTAFHNVHGLKKVQIQLSKDEGTEVYHDVKIVGFRADKDIAILQPLKVDALKNIKHLEFRMKDIEVGLEGYYCSNPYLIQYLFSKGMIGKIKDDFRYLQSANRITTNVVSFKQHALGGDIIQEYVFKAVISKSSEAAGSSGGVFVDKEGKIIAMLSGGIKIGSASAITVFVHRDELIKYSKLIIKNKRK